MNFPREFSNDSIYHNKEGEKNSFDTRSMFFISRRIKKYIITNIYIINYKLSENLSSEVSSNMKLRILYI